MRYKQLARAQNECHSVHFYVQMTFFDRIENLRMEYDRLTLDGSLVTGRDVVTAFNGAYTIEEKQMRSMVQCATTVMRLYRDVIRAIGLVTNEKHPDICLSSPQLNKKNVITADEIMSTAYCRSIKISLTFHH